MKFEDSGTLAVRTYIAGGALPLANSVVRIQGANEENRFVEYAILTDKDGVTGVITLPTPAEMYSLTPGANETPYSSYNLIVSADGYYTKKISDVAIFAQTNSILPISMIPLPVRNDVSYPKGNLDARVIENEMLEGNGDRYA